MAVPRVLKTLQWTLQPELYATYHIELQACAGHEPLVTDMRFYNLAYSRSDKIIVHLFQPHQADQYSMIA